MKTTITLPNTLSHCISRENGRYAIEGLNLIIKDGKGSVAATNGRILCVRDIGEIDGENSHAIIASDTIGKNPTKNAKYYQISIDGDTVGGFVKTGQTVSKQMIGKDHKPKDGDLGQASRFVEGSFPPVSDIHPSDTEYQAFCVNPNLLNALAQAVQGEPYESQGVVLLVPINPDDTRAINLDTELGSDKDRGLYTRAQTKRPVFIIGTDKKCAGAIMPISLEDESHGHGYASIARNLILNHTPAR